MRVQLLNAAGAVEAGIDGGGLLREFLSELLKSAFDPFRGFFLLTRDQTLYPNPAAHLLHDNIDQHYFFIGRMLGKVSNCETCELSGRMFRHFLFIVKINCNIFYDSELDQVKEHNKISRDVQDIW